MALQQKKIKRLKGRDRITAIFDMGEYLHTPHLGVRFQKDTSTTGVYVGVSVSKKRFPKAVDRNTIKRKLRACLATTIKLETLPAGAYMFLFLGTTRNDLENIQAALNQLVKKLA
jgi:ribonuclease P protein component